jgi:hypothetical protein
MPGCLDNCYLYFENASIDNLPLEDQFKLEEELEKFRKGEEYDPSLILQLNQKRCLGGYFKDSNKLRKNCRHYWECLDELSINKRIEILKFREDKKWKYITLYVSIFAIIVSGFFAYLNFSKPTDNKLKEEIKLLQTNITNYETIIEDQKTEMYKMKLKLESMNE